MGLFALIELGLVDTLKALGVNGVLRASIIGNVIGRMGRPGSEWATWNWLQQHSALGELIDVDFLAMSHMSLYRASDVLMKHREMIEARLFSSLQTLFDLEETVTLYDLTNTYLESEATGNEKAKRGRSMCIPRNIVTPPNVSRAKDACQTRSSLYSIGMVERASRRADRPVGEHADRTRAS